MYLDYIRLSRVSLRIAAHARFPRLPGTRPKKQRAPISVEEAGGGR